MLDATLDGCSPLLGAALPVRSVLRATRARDFQGTPLVLKSLVRVPRACL